MTSYYKLQVPSGDITFRIRILFHLLRSSISLAPEAPPKEASGHPCMPGTRIGEDSLGQALTPLRGTPIVPQDLE